MSPPICFISYSWDSEDHKKWVREFAVKLTENGIQVFLDQWDVSLGEDVTQWMEKSIEASDFVLMICTPEYAIKANSRRGGVGYESTIITGDLYEKTGRKGKYVPVLKGDRKTSRPTYLGPRFYCDLRSDDTKQLEELLRHLHNEPKHRRPELGKKPVFLESEEENHVNIEVGKEKSENLEKWMLSGLTWLVPGFGPSAFPFSFLPFHMFTSML